MRDVPNEGRVAFIDLSDEDKLAIIAAKPERRCEAWVLHEGWGPATTNLIVLDGVYRTKPRPRPYAHPDLWEWIDPAFNFAAMDENGDWYVFEKRPANDGARFWCSDGEHAALPFQPGKLHANGCDWKDTLIARPGYEVSGDTP